MRTTPFSGIFRISVSRGDRGAVGVEDGGGGGWTLSEKNHFVPKMMLGCILRFDAVFNTQKTRTVSRSLATWVLRLNRETKRTKTEQKLTVRPKGGVRRSHHRPLNTPLSPFQSTNTARKMFAFCTSSIVVRQQTIAWTISCSVFVLFLHRCHYSCLHLNWK